MKRFVFCSVAITMALVATLLPVAELNAEEVSGTHIVMSAANRYAVDFGVRIAQRGGNPVDVAVAMVLTMAVTNQSFSSLGGGGFAMVKMVGKTEPGVAALDFRETAPSRTNKETFSNRKPEEAVFGGLSVGVPGLPAGLWELHQKFGSLPWESLFWRLSNSRMKDFGKAARSTEM